MTNGRALAAREGSEMFKLSIETDNAAFESDTYGEVARILAGVLARVRTGEDEGAIRDINGNKVGSFEFTD